MAKIHGEWQRCHDGWDYCFCIVVERNGKRDETIIYHKLFDTSVLLKVPLGLSYASWDFRANKANEVSGLNNETPNHISCRDSIDIHYNKIKQAVKKGLENTEVENEIRNYYW